MNKASFRNGDVLNAEFNTPSGLVIYNSTVEPGSNNVTVSLYSFNSASDECLHANKENYTSCLKEDLVEGMEVDRQNIKLITTGINETNLYSDISSSYKYQYLFITDKLNNCIRKIDLIIGEVTTYAGTCNPTGGFKDGPPGTSLFNNPEGLGIDDDGILFVYDLGNKYIRMISTDGYVSTLINGACFEYQMLPKLENKFLRYLLCFK